MSLRSMNGTRTMNLVGGATGGGVNPSLVYDFLVSANPIVPFGLTTTTTISANGTHVNSAGLVTQNTANVWPLDYDPVTLQPLGRPIWEARTNLLLRSAEFDNAIWVAVGSPTVQANAAVSPDGGTNAEKLRETAATDAFGLSAASAAAASTAYCLSFFGKADERSALFLQATDGTQGAFGICNVSDGSLGASGGYGSSPFTNVSISTEAYGNGWYRCILSFTTAASTAALSNQIYLYNSSTSYPGTLNSGAFIWGAQLEAGAFPTPYIPTAGAAVTRAADDCLIALGSWFNASAGTLVVEYAPGAPAAFTLDQYIAELGDGGASERSLVARTGVSGASSFIVVDGGAIQANIASTASTTNATSRVAAAYAVNDFAVSAAGAVPSTDTTGTLPTVTNLYLGRYGGGSNFLNGWERKLAFYPLRLPNDQLPYLYA